MITQHAAHPVVRGSRFLPWMTNLTILLACILSFGPLSSRAPAQVGQQEIPSLQYRAAFSLLNEGEYKDGLEEFLSADRGAIKTIDARWIDSICYQTMIGECYYQMGHLGKALDHYTAAVRLYVAYSGWMLRVQFPPGIRPSANRRMAPWGVSTRRSRPGHFPATMMVSLGRIDNQQQLRHGGIVQQAHLRPIKVQEIVRCTALAIRRRTKLMGPVCQHDRLTSELIAALSRPTGPPNHWSEAWTELLRGLALVAGGKADQALPSLQRATVAAGEFDHPLTSVALFELGRLQLAQGHFDAAGKFFQEATYAAAFYSDAGVLEEAFRGAALAHLLSNQKIVYPQFRQAVQWAKLNDLRKLQASLLLSEAENYAALGQTPQAAALLDEVRLVIGRRQMGAGRLGCRSSFLSSLVLFQKKRIAEGDAALAAAMTFMRQGSYWLFHISLADALFTSGDATARVAMELYSKVLRDPQPADWTADPMESLAVLTTPHMVSIERWFEVALQRKEHERALEISDVARRHRFFSSLAFGGRLQSLRWILEGPDEVLDQQSQLLRRDLLTRYRDFDQLAQQARTIHTELEAMPLVIEAPEASKKQRQALERLSEISLQQEAVLRQMAVGREPARLVFPPLHSTQYVQKSLPEGHALLSFFATDRYLYAFLLNNQRYAYWRIKSPDELSKAIVELLRETGHFQENHELTLKDLADVSWKHSSAELLKLITEGSNADFSQKLNALVVVPDGVLWYLPFEALQVEVGGQTRPLISRFPIRYAPTVSLAVSSGRSRRPPGNTAVVVGRLFPRDAESVARAAFEHIAKEVPGTEALKPPPPGSSAVYSTIFDRLIVLDDLNLTAKGPYGWSPLPLYGGKTGNVLGDWFELPWGGPQEIILPGYHTAAEDSMKRVDAATAGNEVFLSICGLMSGGTRTLLLSRWRTGGQTSFDLVREFVKRLPKSSPAEAWRESVFLTAGSPLNIDAEPRVRRTAAVQPPMANHPFFWAGYLLIDSGTPPPKPGEGPDKAALKLPPPNRP